ncbi:MAG: carbohydrate-binding domain-containing protein [Clostridia bacterium]|nr:carbohydrate-binding domain-containing protein [Clostridia bacterium]
MKKKLVLVCLVILIVVLSFSLVACGMDNLITNNSIPNEQNSGSESNNQSNDGSNNNNTNTSEEITVNPVTDETIEAEETTEEFSIVTEVEDGYTVEGNIYTITVAGEYTLSGSLNGQILVDCEDEVVLNLSNTTISYSLDSPIKSIGDGKLTISAKNDTENVIKDTRSVKTVDDNSVGEGAIYAVSDLDIQGKGVLVVEAGYNNGIHTKGDLKIKNLSLKVTAIDNALKGNDSITIQSGNIVLISTCGDGMKTSNTDLSSKGKQRGNIDILDGNISIYAAGDGIQAAYNFNLSEDEETKPLVTIYTGSYSGYTSKSSTCDSFKGVKADNEINITGGQIDIKSYDDGLHANYGVTLDNGSTSTGIITISGGVVNIGVYSQNNSTGMGNWGPRSSMQTSVSGADGIHADNTINISGGTIIIDTAYEGIEANFVNISGGSTKIYSTDDGVNAANKIEKTPAVTVSGGYLDITMGSGDIDGIDSNGSYTQTGGIVITRGAPNGTNSMATGLDCDGTARITGGTFVQFGSVETTLTKSSNVYKASFGVSSSGFGGGFMDGGRPGSSQSSSSSSYTFSSGTWYLSSNPELFEATLTSTYYGCTVYSDSIQSGNITITNGSTQYTATAS